MRLLSYGKWHLEESFLTVNRDFRNILGAAADIERARRLIACESAIDLSQNRLDIVINRCCCELANSFNNMLVNVLLSFRPSRAFVFVIERRKENLVDKVQNQFVREMIMRFSVPTHVVDQRSNLLE